MNAIGTPDHKKRKRPEGSQQPVRAVNQSSVRKLAFNHADWFLGNPHNPDTGTGDVDHLLPEYEKLLAQIAETRG